MFPPDRKIANAALKLAESYSDELLYDESAKELQKVEDLHNVMARVYLDIAPEDVKEGIDRLIERGLFAISRQFWGGYTFHITSRLRYRWGFFFMEFSHQFWGGFIAGFASALGTVLVALIISYVVGLWALK